MLYTLLITSTTLGAIFEYAICLFIIVVSLIAFGFLRRKTKKEMRTETVKKSCLKAKQYAEEILNEDKHKGAHILLGSTRLGYLSGLVADASWYAYQIVDARKDILFEGIAGSLDTLASELSVESDDVYIPVGEYQALVKKAIKELEATLEKLDGMIVNK